MFCRCNVAYKSQRGFTRHQEEHVASISLKHKFDCECGFPASSEKKLRYHKKVIHQESTKHSCPKCPFQANRPGQLRLHLAKVIICNLSTFQELHKRHNYNLKSKNTIHFNVIPKRLNFSTTCRCQFAFGNKNQRQHQRKNKSKYRNSQSLKNLV